MALLLTSLPDNKSAAPAGSGARHAVTPSGVSGWGFMTSRLQRGEGFWFLFQMDYTTPNTKRSLPQQPNIIM